MDNECLPDIYFPENKHENKLEEEKKQDKINIEKIYQIYHKFRHYSYNTNFNIQNFSVKYLDKTKEIIKELTKKIKPTVNNVNNNQMNGNQNSFHPHNAIGALNIRPNIKINKNIKEKKGFNLILPIINTTKNVRQKSSALNVLTNPISERHKLEKIVTERGILQESPRNLNSDNSEPKYPFGKKFLILGANYNDIANALIKRGWTRVEEGEK